MRLQRITAVAHASGNRIDLTWVHPDPVQFPGVRVVRREGTHPTTPQPGSPGEGIAVADTNPTAPEQRLVKVGEDGLYHVTDAPLKGETVYYYALFPYAGEPPVYAFDRHNRTAAMASAAYNMAGQMSELLPTIYHRYDTVLPTPGDTVVDSDRHKGQLRRFLELPGSQLDQLYSCTRAMLDLHNLDKVDGRLLPLLAQWIGWQTDFQLDIAAQRNEIKFAPHLYRSVGTAPNLQAIVHRYTGWYTQIAEFAQHIARSNLPAQLNIFAIAESTGGWNATDDAAPILGFGSGNAEASGSDGGPAHLVSTASQPFRLRPGMELAITADRRLPMVMRFQPGDFADITTATAAEVASVLNRTLSEVTATAQADGRLLLRSHRVGPDSTLRVEPSAASLVTLEGAPCGRLSAFVDATARIRLFYETADPQGAGTEQAAAHTVSNAPLPTGRFPKGAAPPAGSIMATPVRFVPPQLQGHLRYKTFRNGAWVESHPLLALPNVAQGDPAAVELLPLPDGSRPIWLAWIDHPHTNAARLRFARGTARTPQPARLRGQRSEPFRIVPGTHLLFRGNWPEAEGFTFTETDFPDPRHATAAQVEAALNARLTHVTASAQPNRTLLLSTVGAGEDERLEIDIRHSSAASALGFNAGNAAAFGDGGDGIDWENPQDVTAAPAGHHHADLHAVVAADGIVWLFWAMHVGSNWHIVSSRWNGETWSPLETIADGLGGNREPWAVLDQTHRIWVFWARRQGVGTMDDTWTLRRRVFNPVTGTWDAEEVAVTTPPPGGRAADREPSGMRLSNGDLRLFFRSDRAGSADLWSITVRPAAGAAVGPPSAITADAAADHAPAPLSLPDDTLWLLYRSDRSIPLSRVATQPSLEVKNRVTSHEPAAGSLEAVPLRSMRVMDTGTLRRFAGSTSVILGDAARLSRHRLWDDLLAYTPQKPLGPAGGEALRDDDLYTRGTVGLYLSQAIPDTPFTRQMVDRLRPVLARFLPINVRAVVILTPRLDIEYAYGRGVEIGEAYEDDHPLIELLTGLGEDTNAPRPSFDWAVLHANVADQVSADPANLPSLRRRAYFPDLL
jgi:phage tail-like protein